MTRAKSGAGLSVAWIGLGVLIGAAWGCNSSSSTSGSGGRMQGAGGVSGLGGTTSSGGNSGVGAGGLGKGGAGSGGIRGQAVGGAGVGGIGAGGVGAGGACAGLGCPSLDASCGTEKCAQDAASNLDVPPANLDVPPANLDVPPACSQLRTQAECDQRGDCHSVSFDQKSCACPTPGCCMRFDHCENGGTVLCSGSVSCTQATPYCEAPYAVQYEGGCYYGCVLSGKCAPTAICPLVAPSNGASCGGGGLSCIYQDCSGAGRSEANCLNGSWSVRTVACDSVTCKGGGVYSGGDVICGTGQICVRTTGGGGAYVITPSCAANTCSPSPVTLACMSGLGGSCYVSSDTEIDCSATSLCPGGCP